MDFCIFCLHISWYLYLGLSLGSGQCSVYIDRMGGYQAWLAPSTTSLFKAKSLKPKPSSDEAGPLLLKLMLALTNPKDPKKKFLESQKWFAPQYGGSPCLLNPRESWSKPSRRRCQVPGSPSMEWNSCSKMENQGSLNARAPKNAPPFSPSKRLPVLKWIVKPRDN